ncbi:MAG: hypothetical protein KDK30_14410, partial [Leptospiraceae bacterium]|nr:hypothetical protein [Leptospiraceae bacterium]
LQRERIVREKRGREDLAVMNLFLVPGSCYPLREIHRADFPDFRGRVIGESRTPLELGIERGEDAVLTGCWYQKFNHTLYYSVGGDNGQLVRTLWNSARSLSTPAFFFALGQFVHDCFAENYIYYRTGTQRTFRECIEDYYRMEDKVRKNRGEKMGRRKLDNSRPAIRFMFGVNYARLLMEALTGTSQSHFRHRATEDWLEHNVGLPLLNKSDRSRFMRIRREARDIILVYNGQV